MTGSSTSVIRKRITVIASREVSDDGVEMITSILPRRFAVKFKILKTGTLTYSICSEVAQAITTYSSMEGETLVLLIPDHAPLPSCQNRHNGSVIFTRRKTHNTFRYGSISGRRNLDKIGSKEEVLEYLDMITTAKDALPGEALGQEDNPSQGYSITFFVMVFLMLALLIAIAVLLVQCIRLRKAKRMSLRKIQRIGYSVDSNRDEKEVQEKLDRTQDTDGDSVTAIELKSEERISAETPRDETPLAKTPGSHLKDANASAEFFVKAEAARSLTEVLVMPVSANEFIRYLQMVARFTIEWSDNPVKCSVTSDDLPGTLYNTIPLRAPETPDTFEELLHDIKCKIVTKITHWQHPRFHAFYPSGPCYTNTLGNFITHTLTTIAKCDDNSPPFEELDYIVTNWVGRALGLPESFLFQDDARNSTGGGTVVRSASNAIFYFIMTSKRRKVAQLMALSKKPQSAFRELMQEVGPKLVVYINKDAHPYAEKACAMAMVKCHAIQAKSSNKWSLTGAEVEEQIQQDLAKKLIPLLVYCTVGTTPSAIVDHLESIGPIAKKYDLWMHCDASYGGNCWIEPNYRPASVAFDFVTSVNVSLHKFLLHGNGDMVWTKEHRIFKDTFEYCQGAVKIWHEGRAVMCDWGVDRPRRIRALTIWLALRLNGLQGLRYYVTNAVETCAYFAQLIRAHPHCKIVSHNYALLCFQYTVSNNNLISVAINYDKTSETHVDNSWLVMKSLIEEFSKRRDDPYLLLEGNESQNQRKISTFERMYGSAPNTPDNSPTKDFQSSSSTFIGVPSVFARVWGALQADT